ncbi:putative MnhB-related membrane protein [Bradyrhizobium sp. USDA 4011]
MECHAALIYSLLMSPDVDLDEVRFGQLLVALVITVGMVLFAVSSLLFGRFF